MSFDTFKKEKKVIAKGEKFLKAEAPDEFTEQFEWLLKSYKKLFKTTRRLVKMSDRSEERLKSANEKIRRQQKELKKAHSELVHQNEILTENAQLREDVERITRNDLKTPLNPILSYPALMKNDDNLNEKQVKYINTIESSGRKIINMINMSLDMYKMEQGTYEVKPENVDLMQLLREIQEETRIRIKVKRIKLNTIIDDAPAGESDAFSVKGEKLLIYSMLSNLFKNAVEASPKKETLTLQMKHGGGGAVSIHNQGVVPEEIRDTFFEKYATAGKSGGTGLGTYSASLIAETLGGKISLDTSEENGTTISIFFKDS